MLIVSLLLRVSVNTSLLYLQRGAADQVWSPHREIEKKTPFRPILWTSILVAGNREVDAKFDTIWWFMYDGAELVGPCNENIRCHLQLIRSLFHAWLRFKNRVGWENEIYWNDAFLTAWETEFIFTLCSDIKSGWDLKRFH